MKIKEMNNPAEIVSELTDKTNVVLDFYANWCGPCKNFALMLKSVKDDPALSNVDVIKINVDEYQRLMSFYEVKSLPTIVFTKKNSQGNYDLVEKKIGSMNSQKFIATVVKTYEQ